MSKTNPDVKKSRNNLTSEADLTSITSSDINLEEMRRSMLKSLEASKNFITELHQNQLSALPKSFDIEFANFMSHLDGFIYGMKLIDELRPKGSRPKKKEEYLIALRMMTEYFKSDTPEVKKGYPPHKTFLRMLDEKIDKLSTSGNKKIGRVSEKTAETWLTEFKKPLPIKNPKK
jgi:hypothetical protein